MGLLSFHCADPTEWTAQAVLVVGDAIRDAAKTGRCVVGLSGGNTPGPVYEGLRNRSDINWKAVHVFLVDERYVDATEERSNTLMLRKTLLRDTLIPEENIHVPNTSLPIDECVADYDAKLRALLTGKPADVVVLGMGGDGHIASLFPPLPEKALGGDYVIHTETLQFAVKDRISVTLPILSAAKSRVLLIKGKDKNEAWHEMMLSPGEERMWPVLGVMETGLMILVTDEPDRGEVI